MFINASRGMVVDDDALREHILSGHLAGAAIDVFPVEPKAQGDPFESPLRGLDNVILTPHVGGSTQEAQEEIGHFVANKLRGFVTDGRHGALGQPAGGRRRRLRRARSAGLPAPQRARACWPSINQMFAEAGANVVGQSLSTRGEHGYVVTDTDVAPSDAALAALRQSPHTVWLRSWRG